MGPARADRILVFGYAVLTAAAFFGFAIVALLPVALGLPSRPISVLYRAGVVAASFVYVWRAVACQRPLLPRHVLWPVGLLTAMLLLRMLWDSLVTPLPLDLPWDEYWLQVIAFALLPSLPYLLVPPAEALALARRLCIATGAIAVAAIAAGAYLSVHRFTSGSRLTTDVMNPIGIGEIGVSLFVVCLATPPPRTSPGSGRIALLLRAAGAVMGVILCIVSASKGPLLSLGVLSMVMFASRAASLPRHRRIAELSFATVVLVGLIALGIVLQQHGLLAIYDRFSDIASDRSTAVRLQAWLGAMGQFDSSPLFGSSFVELSTRFYPHNNVLETMMAVGVGGLLLLLLLLALSSAASLTVIVRARQWSWVALLFLQHAISGLLSGSIYRTGAFWISMLMILGVYRLVQQPTTAVVPAVQPGS